MCWALETVFKAWLHMLLFLRLDLVLVDIFKRLLWLINVILIWEEVLPWVRKHVSLLKLFPLC